MTKFQRRPIKSLPHQHDFSKPGSQSFSRKQQTIPDVQYTRWSVGKLLLNLKLLRMSKTLLQSSTLSKKVKKFTPPLKITSVTSTVPKAKCPVKAQKKTSINKTPKKSVKHVEPQPGPSGKQTILLSDDSFRSDSSSEVDDSEKCSVCKLYQPKELKNCVSLILTKWGQCMFQDYKHWVHLQFCCDVRVLRLRDIFYCPCHGVPSKPSEE